MYDILILAPTGWKLRRAVKVLNQTFSELKLEKHPDKTMIGRTEKWTIALVITLALTAFPERIRGWKIPFHMHSGFMSKSRGEPSGSPLPGLYVKRWCRWVNSGSRVDAYLSFGV